MYAIIKSGGKQYQIIEGQKLHLELLDGKKGDKLKFQDVLAAYDGSKLIIGNPTLTNVLVEFEILDFVRDKKIIVFKKKRRKDYQRKHGHRQNLTSVKILKINFSSSSEKKTVKKEKEDNKADVKKTSLTKESSSKESKVKKTRTVSKKSSDSSSKDSKTKK